MNKDDIQYLQDWNKKQHKKLNSKLQKKRDQGVNLKNTKKKLQIQY